MDQGKTPWVQGTIQPAMAGLPAHLSLYMNDATYSTDILPVVIGGEQYILVAYCLASGRLQDEPQEVLPPFIFLYIRYPDKEYKWQEINASDYNEYGFSNLSINDFGQQTLGVLESYDAAVTTEILRKAQVDYIALVSLVIEQKWLIVKGEIDDEQREVAQRLNQCMTILYDKVFYEFYKKMGPDFTSWVELCAGGNG